MRTTILSPRVAPIAARRCRRLGLLAIALFTLKGAAWIALAAAATGVGTR